MKKEPCIELGVTSIKRNDISPEEISKEHNENKQEGHWSWTENWPSLVLLHPQVVALSGRDALLR